MNRFSTLCLWLFAMLISTAAFSQMTITGIVTDEEAQPLIGVNILIQGTAAGTITDFDGTYSIEASEGDVLVYSYTGYATQEIAVGTATTLDVTLAEGTALDEVVVVAYGTQKKVTVTGAVAQLKGEELVESPVVNLSNSLAGRLPGLVVVQPSGEPGADDATISIRGTNTLGNSSPLVVIDGIPDRAGGLSRLLGQDIASISVLKDASAAIYGARAANGAILVTTKQGEAGKTRITYDFNQGWTQPTVVPPMSNSFQYANIMNELPIYRSIPVDEWGNAWSSIQNTGVYDSPTPGIATINAPFSPEAVSAYRDGTDPLRFPNSDWFGATFKEWAPQQQHYVGISGGSEKVQYYASLGYLDQDAIYQNSATFYKQYSGRVNLNANINKYVTTNIGINLRREDRNFPTESADAIFRMLMRGRPTEPAVWPNGLPGPDIENGQQPVVITTNATGYDRRPNDYAQINGSVNITNPWVRGLKLTLSGAVDKLSGSRKLWQTPWELYFWDGVSFEGNEPVLEGAVRSNFKLPQLTQSSFSGLNTNLTAILSYDANLVGGHRLNLLAGTTREEFTGDFFSAFRRDFISPAIDQLFAGGQALQNTDGSAFIRPRLGYYGRVKYSFSEKYLAEFIWRYDGSYIFPGDDRFGFFPGILLGWNVTSEDWFNPTGLDHLKIRASYGQMGNDQVFFNGALQEFAYLSTYSFGQFPINSQVSTTLGETILANPSFTWERANNFNVGLDASLFGRLDVVMEYFFNRRDQILIQETGSTPASSGISNLLPPVNAGEVVNTGFEFGLTYNGGPKNGDFRWTAGINGGYAKNEVVFIDEVPGAPEYQLQEGKPIGAWLVYESDGVFRDQAAIEANTLDYSEVTPQLIPGDMRFIDQNGDGIINGDDQVRLEENQVPTFNFGATFRLYYKDFDLSVLFQGATGASTRFQTESGDIGNYLQYSHDNRWRIDNPSSEHPRLASRGDTYYTGGAYGNNTYFLFDKDYIRLKNLEIGYNMNGQALERFGLENLRIFANGFNLLTFSKFDFFDPENNNAAGRYYPLTRVLNLGFGVTF
ncbi:MAG: TonB-dependent receptor [Bacteroidota bacterium]